jgi:hypothetical protein
VVELDEVKFLIQLFSEAGYTLFMDVFQDTSFPSFCSLSACEYYSTSQLASPGTGILTAPQFRAEVGARFETFLMKKLQCCVQAMDGTDYEWKVPVTEFSVFGSVKVKQFTLVVEPLLRLVSRLTRFRARFQASSHGSEIIVGCKAPRERYGSDARAAALLFSSLSVVQRVQDNSQVRVCLLWVFNCAGRACFG